MRSVTFTAFPRQWIPVFEWLGADWKRSSEPANFVPFFSDLDEAAILAQVRAAKAAGQLRLLAEIAASADVVLCETMQRIDGLLDRPESPDRPTTLTTWHGYNRRSLRELDKEIAAFKSRSSGVVFIPCAKSRPYSRAPSFKRLMKRLEADGICMDGYEKIVLTSIGPVPESLWGHEVVLAYDTGIRDLYRLLTQLRALLRNNSFSSAIDVLPLAQYGDLLDILHLEGALPPLSRPSWLRRRNIPIYRPIRPALEV